MNGELWFFYLLIRADVHFQNTPAPDVAFTEPFKPAGIIKVEQRFF